MKTQIYPSRPIKIILFLSIIMTFTSIVQSGTSTYINNTKKFKFIETPNKESLHYSLYLSSDLNTKTLELKKMTIQGKIEWQNTHSLHKNFKLTSIHYINNKYLIVGYIIKNSTNYDIHTLSISESGKIEWQQTYKKTGIEIPNFIYPCENNDILITGFCAVAEEQSVNTITNDIFLIKISKTGDLLWEKILGLEGVDEEPLLIKKTSDSEYLLVANRKHFQDNFFLIKFNNYGHIIWDETYSINGFLKDNLIVNTNSNGNFTITSDIQVYSPQNNTISTCNISLEINDKGEKINFDKTISDNIDYVYIDTLNKISVNILRGIINRPDVNMRAEPTLNSNIISCLGEGEIVEIIEKTNNPQKIGSMNEHWYRLKLNANIDGWIYGFFLDVIK